MRTYMQVELLVGQTEEFPASADDDNKNNDNENNEENHGRKRGAIEEGKCEDLSTSMGLNRPSNSSSASQRGRDAGSDKLDEKSGKRAGSQVRAMCGQCVNECVYVHVCALPYLVQYWKCARSNL